MALTPESASVPELVEFTLWSGECVGYCTTALRVRGTELELIRSSNRDEEPERRYRGSAAAALTNQIHTAAARLTPATLADVYGKPDSRDEGGATLRLLHRTIVTDHSYSADSPPPELEELHSALTLILEAWFQCAETEEITFEGCP